MQDQLVSCAELNTLAGLQNLGNQRKKCFERHLEDIAALNTDLNLNEKHATTQQKMWPVLRVSVPPETTVVWTGDAVVTKQRQKASNVSSSYST